MDKLNGAVNGAAPLGQGSRRFGSRLIAAFALGALAGGAAAADAYHFTAIAGNATPLDRLDGNGLNARFLNPVGVAVDTVGNIYVADGGDHTVRKVTPGGLVTTLAGSSGQGGSSDGTGGGARFVYPHALAVDADGNVFVTDSGNRTIRKITTSGRVTTLAGNTSFNLPQGIAVDGAGNVFVSDTGNSTIHKIAANGVVTTFAGLSGQTGVADGTGADARFTYPFGLASDAAGNLYVADFGNSAIRKITPGGTVTTLAGTPGATGNADGNGPSARFDHPAALSVDAAGNVYVIDTSNQTVRKISPSGSVSTLAGTAGAGGRADGVGPAARFFYPSGIGVTGAGLVYVGDTGNHTLRVVTAAGSVSTLAGSTGSAGSSDGTGRDALFSYPGGVAVDGPGNLYVADHDNHTIRKVNTSGVVTTFAGAAGVAGSADGTGGAARFNGPTSVAVDGGGNVYVADAGNTSIRKITASGAVTTFAGVSGAAGSTDGAGAGARFSKPQGVAVDSAGNVYVADTGNHTIRKVTSAGVVTTLAGAAQQSGSNDGFGGGARFNGPYAVAVDNDGNVYVTDFFNSTIRKVSAAGAVTTLAGLAGQNGFAEGFGSAARFNQPYGVAVNRAGDVFVTDTYNRAVRKISAAGDVSTVIGANSRFYYPQGIAVDAAGNLYVSDGDNHALSRGVIAGTPPSGSVVASASVAPGGSATFSLGAALPLVNYQWELSTDGGGTWVAVSNSATYSGATTPTLSLSNIPAALNGNRYRVQLSNSAGTGISGTANLSVTDSVPVGDGSARLINVSVRTFVGTGDSTVAVGFGLSGAGAKQLLIRGVGPTLAVFSVSGQLNNPQLGLFNSSSVMINSNNGWGGGAALAASFAAVGAFALPANSADTAIFQSLAAGTTYSALISGANNTTGIALAEVYDADTGTPGTRLTNISARAFSGTGDGALTAGFVIAGSGSETLLIRGIGPALTQFGVGGALARPQLTLFNSAGVAIGTNTTWGGSAALAAAFAQVGAFPLSANSADSALLVNLPPGLYTVAVNGVSNTTGIALIEVYEVR